MRKQTKLVAVASAAALLAIGASMTSFAAAGWVEEDGTWYYYDKDGNKVEDEWKKSGDNWYWLDSEEGGAMAVDKLVEDDDDTYYVDSNGVMVKNTWVKVVNEDQDDDDDPAEYNYYYLQNNGKAYKASSNTGNTKFKTIDGKRYAFDEDGKMLYGWVNTESTRETDESGWTDATYYLGNWDDGALKTGWQKITVYDEDEDEDMDYWFNFQSNGKKRKNKEDWKSKGKYYTFDERGVMVYEWVTSATSSELATSASAWKYFSNPEDGARKTKGWFKVVAPNEDNTFNNLDAIVYGKKDYERDISFAGTDADDEKERWYYADSKGELVVGEIKKINGKYYGFRPDDGEKSGAMLTGLCFLKVDDDGKILGVKEPDMDSDYLDDIIDGKYDIEIADGYSLYYFGNNADEDGSLKTGSVSINLDGETYSMYFSKNGGAEGKGRGVNGIDDGKYIYKVGVKLKADNDEKYIVVQATGDNGNDISADGVSVKKIDSADLRNCESDNHMGTDQNKDGDTIKYHGPLTNGEYYLINTSGAIVKNKTAAKDGDDWYFYVDGKQIKMYANNKTLTGTDNALNWKDDDFSISEDEEE